MLLWSLLLLLLLPLMITDPKNQHLGGDAHKYPYLCAELTFGRRSIRFSAQFRRMRAFMLILRI